MFLMSLCTGRQLENADLEDFRNDISNRLNLTRVPTWQETLGGFVQTIFQKLVTAALNHVTAGLAGPLSARALEWYRS